MSVCDILKDLASPVIMVPRFSKLDKIDKKKVNNVFLKTYICFFTINLAIKFAKICVL